MRLMRYNPTAEYVPGKRLVVADALSRQPQPEPEISELTGDIEALEEAIQEAWPISSTKLDIVKQQTMRDSELQLVKRFVTEGWLKYSAGVPPEVKKYYSVRNHLTTSNELVLYDSRMVIPQCLRGEMLQRIHEGHQGIVKCRTRAKCSMWWPGISKRIQEMVTSCRECQVSQPSRRRETLLTTPLPSHPWEKVAADICELNQENYLVTVDYFSRYIDIAHLKDMSSETTIAKLMNIFARWGCPNELVTDNGPRFMGRAFSQFAKKYDFKHTITSPRYPQVNGEAERAIRTAKTILRQSDPFLALMAYRSTPLQATGVSPAQLMFGRQIPTTVPTLETSLLGQIRSRLSRRITEPN
uniref:Gypsy retrotransposon integrase-like protein 1 n=1 Tax=Monopterus albus TaxID=43700 RepID=A0A3Q3JGA8_MONAL